MGANMEAGMPVRAGWGVAVVDGRVGDVSDAVGNGATGLSEEKSTGPISSTNK